MIKDAGYYYPDFNIEIGSKHLDWVLKNHDDNTEEYNNRNQEILKRYTVHNTGVIETYDRLISNLYKKSKKSKWTYDWKTNLIK